MEARPEMIHAALHTRYIKAEMRIERPLVVTNFEQLTTMMKSQLIVMLAGSVNDYALRLWKGAQRIFHAGGQRQSTERVLLERLASSVMSRSKQHQLQLALCDGGKQALQLLFLRGVQSYVLRRIHS